MVTLPANPTLTQMIAFKLARKLDRTEQSKKATHVRSWLVYTVRLTAQIVGLLCWTRAGFSVTPTAGWIAATIALFMFSWLVTSPPESTEDHMTTFERMNRE